MKLFHLCGILAGCLLSGCGTTLPIMDIEYSTDRKFSDFVTSIAQHVKCEIHKAVAVEFNPQVRTRRPLFGWAAKVALTIRAGDRGTINPGVLLANNPGTFTFGGSGQWEAEATRELTMTYYLPFNEILRDPTRIDTAGRLLDCVNATPDRPIAGNLGIDQTLAAAFTAWDGWNTLSERMADGPFDTLTHHVTFQIVAGVSATPGWRLINVTANGSAALGATRTAVNELLITMGPKILGDRKELNSPLDQSFSIERLKSVITRRP
jgi:hypothetical protein